MMHDVYRKMFNINQQKPVVPPSNLVNDILGKSSFKGNAATAYGVANEPKAILQYSKLTSGTHENFRLEQCGLLIDPEMSFVGGSVDSVRHCNCHSLTVVEIKCPKRLHGKGR